MYTEGEERDGGGETAEVKVWIMKAMSETMMKCSDSQLVQNCQRWRAFLASALQVEHVVAFTLHCDLSLPSSPAAVVTLLVRSALR